MTLGRIDRFLLVGSLIALAMVAASAAYATGYAQSLRAALASMDGSGDGSAWIPMIRALTVAQAAAVAAFGLLAVVLFSLSWFIRTRLREPLAHLAGALEAQLPAADLSVVANGDEIARLTRAAKLMNDKYMKRDTQTIEQTARLRNAFDELEAATVDARRRIDQACLEAAKASRGALEAATLAQRSIRQMESRAQTSLAKWPAQANGMNAGADLPPFVPAGHKRSDALETLMRDLDAVENHAPARQPLAHEEASTFNATVIGAIDRLNVLAERVAAAANRRSLRALP